MKQEQKTSVDTSFMIFVGKFNETEIKAGVDRERVKAKRIIHPTYKYTHTEIEFKGGKPVALKVWISKTF